MKLEIGCGLNPQPGYEHLDVRALPDVEHVCNFEKEPIPIESNEVEEVLGNHVIEHVSFRSLPFVVGEWFRILKPNGRLFLRTPDLEFICRMYLEGKTTPEWPADEQFVKNNLCEDITPAWWANIKLYGGQDYPSNFHLHCFDYQMLKRFLERQGFVNVNRLSTYPVYSPGEIQVEAFKPNLVKKILIKRASAMGDVLSTTPIIRHLKELEPEAIIDVATNHTDIFNLSPYVNRAYPVNHPIEGYDKVIDLDLCYEKKPAMHVVDAYSLQVFNTTDYDKSLSLYQSKTDDYFVNKLLSDKGIKDPAPCVVVHPTVSWKSRTWPRDRWLEVIRALENKGIRAITIGDELIGIPAAYSLGIHLSVQQIANLISKCACFVGSDSGLLHVAGTTDTPIVGLFTSVNGLYRVPYRHGAYGALCTIVKPDLECYGCLAEEKPPVTFHWCKRNDHACLDSIKPEMVINAILSYI